MAMAREKEIGLNPIERGKQLMRTTRQLSITLPNEMADALKERVRSGAYASESEVVRDGLRALFARDRAVESWLREDVAEVYDALVADPADVLTADELREQLSARHSSTS